MGAGLTEVRVPGETSDGVKTTRSAECIRPGTVIYDVEQIALEAIERIARDPADHAAGACLLRAAWLAGTRTGQTCDGTRQEPILLSDVLGPFYVEGPPEQDHGEDLSGAPLRIDIEIGGTAGNSADAAAANICQSNEDGYCDAPLFVGGGSHLGPRRGRGDAVFGVKDRLVADYVPHRPGEEP